MDFLGDFMRNETNGIYLASRGAGKRTEVYSYKVGPEKTLAF